MILTVLNNTPAPRLPKRETIPDVWATIADTYPGITLDHIRSDSKRDAFCKARHHLMFELWITRNRWSTTVIGRHLGDRDHSTVIYGARRHAHYILEMPSDCLTRDQMRAELRAREAAELETAA